MSVLPDQKILETLITNNIPRGINLDVDKEELRKNLMECGLEKRFVQNLIKVLGAGMTLDVDWEFLDDMTVKRHNHVSQDALCLNPKSYPRY